jgi:plasmid stabilization system protein ParE
VKIEYHPAVEQDISEALRRYDSVSPRLGDEFKAELHGQIAIAARWPGRFHQIKPDFHRTNLKRFPYHIIYRKLGDRIRVTLVRHHRRNPDFGMERD